MAVREHEYIDVGTAVAGYRIVSVVKSGGFGNVYRTTATGRKVELTFRQLGPSRTPPTLGEYPVVALKEFYPSELVIRVGGRVTPKKEEYRELYDHSLGKFISESQRLILDFDHPNIVRGTDLFFLNGTYYFAMEFIEGCSLLDWLIDYQKACGHLPDEQTVKTIFEQLLDAVAHIHDVDQMHRDIKPENIMMRRNGSPVLIDFGLVGEGLDKARKGTLAAMTPGYAPPEQTGAQFMPFAGRIVDLRRQGRYTDIYAIAAVLYRAIVGVPPPIAEDRIDRVTGGEVEDIDVALACVSDRYSKTMLKGIARALSLDPSLRPASIAEFRAALGWNDPYVRPFEFVVADAETARRLPVPSNTNAIDTVPAPPTVAAEPVELPPAVEETIAPGTRYAAVPSNPWLAGVVPADPPPSVPGPRTSVTEPLPRRRGRNWLAVTALTALLAIFAFAWPGPSRAPNTPPDPSPIEAAVARVNVALAAERMNWTQVSHNTMEIIVSGKAPSFGDRDKAISLSRQASGNVSVRNEVEVDAPPPPPIVQHPIEFLQAEIGRISPALLVSWRNNDLVVSGYAPREDIAERAVTRVRELAGGRRVIDEIDTNGRTEVSAVERMQAQGVADGSASATRTAIVITGRVTDDAARAAVEREVRSVIGNRQLESRLDTNAAAKQRIEAALREGGFGRIRTEVTLGEVVLNGLVEDERERASVLALVRPLANGRSVRDALTTRLQLQSRINQELRAAGVQTYTVEVHPGEIRLTPRNPSIFTEEVRARSIVRQYAEEFGLRVTPEVGGELFAIDRWWSLSTSLLYNIIDGNRYSFYYLRPRLPRIAPHTLFMAGERNGDSFEGYATAFSESCGALTYRVTGRFVQGPTGEKLVVRGQAPQIRRGDSTCTIAAHEDRVVELTIAPAPP